MYLGISKPLFVIQRFDYSVLSNIKYPSLCCFYRFYAKSWMENFVEMQK